VGGGGLGPPNDPVPVASGAVAKAWHLSAGALLVAFSPPAAGL